MTITELVLENQKMKLDAQSEAEHHDKMVGELEKVYKERDEARDAIREAWLAMDETDGTDRMINWQNKYTYILEETK